MKKLSEEFARVADIIRFGNDEPIGYAVFVGHPDLEFTFLEKEKFLHEDFTTRRDAQNAFNLVRRTLTLIDDENEDAHSLSPISRDNLRRELIKAVDKAVERAISKGVRDFDDVSLYAVISAEVVYELNNTFLNFFNRH